MRKFDKTFSAIASWIKWASKEMVETTWKVVDEASWLSKKPTSCLRTDFKYSILMRDACLSAVLVQQIPSAKFIHRTKELIKRMYP